MREICIADRLASGGDELIGLLTGDGALEATAADQLLFGPGWLPDQQTEGIGS